MNYRMILRILGRLCRIQAVLLVPGTILAGYDGELRVLWGFLATMALLLLFSFAARPFASGAENVFYAREGFLMVASSWILMSVFGALPFCLSGVIPDYFNAFFETVSGFTTTGATILTGAETMPRALILWRSLTYWLGGMGILVFMLAVLPAAKGGGESLFVLRAESPGPSVEKIAPKISRHAAILYLIYVVMTVLCGLFLCLGGMPLFDSICTAFGTASTGGYSVRADSMISYSTASQTVVAVFMLLFGVNFNVYFLILLRRFGDAFRHEEMRVYLGVVAASVLMIALNILHLFGSVREALHHAFFTVSSIVTTSGFATTNFSLWPQFSRAVILLLMALGACAGSSGGGFKVARALILLKAALRGLYKMLHPRIVTRVKMNGKSVDDSVLEGVYLYMTAYLVITLVSFLLVSLDDFSLETSLSAVISCMNNVGAGLGAVGPMGNYHGFSALSKAVLMADMLLGRLEIFPILILFNARSWNRAA